VDQSVILSQREQEYVLRALEAAVQVRALPQFFLWTQGQLQGLLPHQLMVCMHFDPGGALLRIEPLHGKVLGEAALRRLCDTRSGLSPRIAAHCAAHRLFPAGAQAGDVGHGRGGRGEGGGGVASPLAPFQHDIDTCGYDNVLVHGTAGLPGGSAVFMLYGMPQRPGPRQAYFMELLLPSLHMAMLRMAAQDVPAAPVAAGHAAWRGGQAPGARPLSAREIDVLIWLREGKTNAELATILGISALTVKNHLQRIYKILAVGNRTEAVARSVALRLLPPAPGGPCAAPPAGR